MSLTGKSWRTLPPIRVTERSRIQSRGDHGPEGTESVEALRAAPLLEGRVLKNELDGGDIVDAGVAEDACLDLRGRDVPALPADHDAELPLEEDPASVGARPPDGPASRMRGGGGLEEVERLLRLAPAVLLGGRPEVVPEPDDLRRIAGGEHLGSVEGDPLVRGFGSGEEIARVHRDLAVLERADLDPAVVPDAYPMAHDSSLSASGWARVLAFSSRRRVWRTLSVYPFGSARPWKTSSRAAWNSMLRSKVGAMGV